MKTGTGRTGTSAGFRDSNEDVLDAPHSHTALRNTTKPRLLMPLHKSRSGQDEFFMVPGLGGHALSTHQIVSKVPEPWRGYGVLYPSFLPDEPKHLSFESMAERIVPEMLAVRPHGRFLLIGYSMGGLLCMEIAKALQAARREVGIVMLDVKLPAHARTRPFYVRWPKKCYWMLRDRWEGLRGRTKGEQRLAKQRKLSHTRNDKVLPPSFTRAIDEGRQALAAYAMPTLDVQVVVIRCTHLWWWDDLKEWPDDYGWQHHAQVAAVVYTPGDHLGMIKGDNLGPLGSAIGDALTRLSDAVMKNPSFPPQLPPDSATPAT